MQQRAPVSDASGRRRSSGLLALALAALIAASYLPALRGGFVWDDDSYVTANPALGSAAGLREIWLSPGATPQYYPLVFTSFWAERRLWGLRPAGYHLVNVAFHAAAALLLWRILALLGVPGAALAAAIWGLHPVNVESVAWITERKNVLSGFFYLAALLAFLRAGGARDGRGGEGGPAAPGSRLRWAGAAGLFACALLSKSVTATLPFALALLWWWQGRRIGRREALALLPLVAAGAALGATTLWMERTHVGARGAEWALSHHERLLIAGRALWFYAGKLLWPAQLTFVYPRWEPMAGSLAGHLPALLAAAAVALLWGLRRRIGRGPLAAVLFFAGTLLPALGFFDVFPMRYTFVADHYVYLASIGPIALAAALLARGARGRLPGAAALVLLLPLGLLTWRQGGAYRDLETLWRDTLAKNPAAWMARNNLGVLLAARGRTGEAIEQYRRALATRPDLSEVRANLGDAHLAEGRVAEAVEEYSRALALESRNAPAHLGLGVAREREGRLGEARAHFERALELRPGGGEARYRLALLLARLGEGAAAERMLSALLEEEPDHPTARLRLADLLAAQGRAAEAERAYREAMRRRPGDPAPPNGLGVLLASSGRLREAREAFERAVALDAAFAPAHHNLGRSLVLLGERDAGLRHLREALRLDPADGGARAAVEESRWR